MSGALAEAGVLAGARRGPLLESLLIWTWRIAVMGEARHTTGWTCFHPASPVAALPWAYRHAGAAAGGPLEGLDAAWRQLAAGGILAGHAGDESGVAGAGAILAVARWAWENGGEFHRLADGGFWIRKPAGDLAAFQVWNQRIDCGAPVEHAFNPAICPHPGDRSRRIFAFRSVKGTWEDGRIWIAEVDAAELCPTGPPVLLDLERPEINCEDPRLFVFGDEVWLGYTTSDWSRGPTISRQHLVALREKPGGGWEAAGKPTRFESPLGQRQEKNWVFFRGATGELLALYSASPEWRIYQLFPGEPRRMAEVVRGPELRWPFGEIRGGTPLIAAPNGHWWTFFHSSSHHRPGDFSQPFSGLEGALPAKLCASLALAAAAWREIPGHNRYFCGLLEISRETLLPRRISTRPLLYRTPPGSGRVGYHVVWPAGAMIDGDEVTLAYGLDDATCHSARFSAKLLDELLVPIASRDQAPEGLNEHAGVNGQAGVNGKSHGGTGGKPGQGPKLGLLFLTRGQLKHVLTWQRFMSGAGDHVRIFTHAKMPAEITGGPLAGTLVPRQWETRWGDISLVRAMLELLREAWLDPSLTHFVFASESCIPLKPWPLIRRALGEDPRSRIAMSDGVDMPAQHALRQLHAFGIPYCHWRFHPQWVLLDREAAGTILAQDMTMSFEHVFAADEHYFGTLLAMSGFDDTRVNRCHSTYVEWDYGKPVEHRGLGDELLERLREDPAFFARKFCPGADLSRLGELWNPLSAPRIPLLHERSPA